ncbi:putative protease inhibitor [Phaeomoniella chlamydospora]|uniref:Putative protease inhibitor n=1 Tax=Phaeomoniella chlamydospora TaxID=158046 RepID=A0A0G2EB93_PHACM|nr:putative protease inhibitor [Phaeomoniella chlamydospora]
MLQIKNIEALLALSKDESKKLGLIIGAQKVTPGQYIPKGGIQPGLTPVKGADSTTKLVAGDEPFIADYAGPGPPPQSSPHRYIFLLYEQPEGLDPAQFALPGRNKVGIWPRISTAKTYRPDLQYP